MLLANTTLSYLWLLACKMYLDFMTTINNIVSIYSFGYFTVSLNILYGPTCQSKVARPICPDWTALFYIS